MRHMRNVGVWVTGLMAGGLVACSPLRMAVPEPLGHEAQPVPIQQERGGLLSNGGTLRVGAFSARYDVDGVDRSNATLFGATACGAKGAYRFALASEERPGVLRNVECREEMSGKKAEFAVGENSSVGFSNNQNRVNCELEGGGRLDLTQTRRTEGHNNAAPIVQGQATLGAVRLLVESTSNQVKGMPVPYLGFHLRRGEQTVASVQVREPTQLWMAADLSPEEREAVVLTAFSLMLQRTWTASGPLDCDT